MVFHQYLSRFLDSLEPNEAKNYRLRFEVFQNYLLEPHKYWLSRTRCCNSAYRLRYATKGARKQRSDDEVRTSLVPDRREGKTIKME